MRHDLFFVNQRSGIWAYGCSGFSGHVAFCGRRNRADTLIIPEDQGRPESQRTENSIKPKNK